LPRPAHPPPWAEDGEKLAPHFSISSDVSPSHGNKNIFLRQILVCRSELLKRFDEWVGFGLRLKNRFLTFQQTGKKGTKKIIKN
jgi:hypothetical protein